jgi:hypothetical protein
MPESLEHLLIKCEHAKVATLRAEIRSNLEGIFEEWNQMLEIEADSNARTQAETAQRNIDGSDPALIMASPDEAASIAIEAIRSQQPDLQDDGQLLAVLMCSTSGGSTTHRPHPADSDATIEERRRRPEVVLDDEGIRRTASWLRPLAAAWQRAVATGTTKSPRAILSNRFLKAVASHSQKLFSLRRTLLKGNEDFKNRRRDPLPSVEVAANTTATHQQQPARRPRRSRPS